MSEQTNLTQSIKELEEIVQWFDDQQEVDVEEGLEKVKSAAGLIKASKARLADIENEFSQIEKEIAEDDAAEEEVFPEESNNPQVADEDDDSPIDLREIPF
jgi:hypothetical protein